MRILAVFATKEEAGPLMSDFGPDSYRDSISDIENSCQLPTANCQLLFTGVGMVATAFALGKHLAENKYDLAINFGIAGSFDKDIELGELVEINQDTFAELGAEDGYAFLPIDQMGFGQSVYNPSKKLADLYNLFNNFNLKTVPAITVNTVHGNETSIKNMVSRLNPAIESMEGAAFFYCCREMNVPCLQIRAVSNYVEKRNRDNWKIGLAIKNLNTFAAEFLKLYAGSG